MAWYDPFINYITGTGSGSLLGDIKDNAGNIALGTAGLGLLSNAYGRLGDIGDESQAGANIIAQQGLQQSQFQPFTVRSTTGSTFGFTPAGMPSYATPYAPPTMFPAPDGGGGGGGYTPPIPPGVQPGQPAPGFVPSKKTQQVDSFAGTRFEGTGGPRPHLASILQTDGMPGPEYIETGVPGPEYIEAGSFPVRAEQPDIFPLGSSAQLSLSPNEKFIQDMLMGQAEQGLFEGPYGELQRQQAAQQAFGLGGQFMGAAGAQPADVLKLRQQYGGLAGQAAQGLLDPMATREADVYERIRATQRPEEERQRLALEERLAQQGRLGVRTSMFGGTPEQLALSKAQEEAQNRASLAAIQQSQAERQQALGTAQTLGGMFGQQAQLGSALQAQQAGLGAQYAGLGSQLAMLDLAAQQAQQQLALGALTGSYIPQAQLMNVAQLGMTPIEMAQRGQLYGAGLFGEGSMTGLQSRLAAALGQANLFGTVGTGLLSGALGVKI